MKMNQFIGHRKFIPVPGNHNVSKIFVWNRESNEYQPPARGNTYRARRYEFTSDGKRVRRDKYFPSLDSARNWQSGKSQTDTHSENVTVQKGPLLREVLQKWKIKKFQTIARSTQVSYEKILRLYFDDLLDVGLYEITTEKVDDWIDKLTDPNGKYMKSTRRISFKHELEVLSAVLRYYDDYHSDPLFRFPVKKRHWKDIKTGRKAAVKDKDVTEPEFLLFRSELSKGPYGHLLAPLATLQYYQALRISEATGVYFGDIRLNRENPRKSRILIQRSVEYLRIKGMRPRVKLGFKNSNQFPNGVKELPVFPQTYEVLAPLITEGGNGLVFQIDAEPVGYRTIQHYYDKAFKAAGLPYTATHVMRHGWTMEVYNRNPDLDIAKQLLGDTSDAAARVYAKRRAGAVTAVSDKMWEERQPNQNPDPTPSTPAEVGCDWVQNEKEKTNTVRYLRLVK